VLVPTSCFYCSIETQNPKFCSRSCAAKYNNTVAPKRSPILRFCSICQIPIQTRRRRCSDCKRSRLNSTIADMKGSGNAVKGGNYAYIRSIARSAYAKSGKAYQCLECGYSLHVDICHIRDINSFSDQTPMYEVNHIDNLIALCKNHHWEFDHGYRLTSVNKDRC